MVWLSVELLRPTAVQHHSSLAITVAGGDCHYYFLMVQIAVEMKLDVSNELILQCVFSSIELFI